MSSFWYMASALILSASLGCHSRLARPPSSRVQLIRGTTSSGVTAATSPRVHPGQPAPQGPGLVGTGNASPRTTRLIQPSTYLSVSTTRSASESCTTGRFSIRLPPRLKPPPTVPDAVTSAALLKLSSCGALVTSFTVPPIEPEPYSVPCGPRSTSTRERSNRSGSTTTLPLRAAAGGLRG